MITYHAQRSLGPFTYTDRELFGHRTRAIWFRTRIIVKWRVK